VGVIKKVIRRVIRKVIRRVIIKINGEELGGNRGD
jgi:hypothetical protein